MTLVPRLLSLSNGYKTYAAVSLAIVSGLGAILTKNQSGGVTDFLQALTLVFVGVSVVGLRHAVSKVPTGLPKTAGKPE
jgi:hypothetical protein